MIESFGDFANLPVGTKIQRIKPNGEPHHIKNPIHECFVCDGHLEITEEGQYFYQYADTVGITNSDRYYIKDGVVWYKKHSTQYLKDILRRAEKNVREHISNKSSILKEWETTERREPEALQGHSPLEAYESVLQSRKVYLRKAQKCLRDEEYLPIYGYKVVS